MAKSFDRIAMIGKFDEFASTNVASFGAAVSRRRLTREQPRWTSDFSVQGG
jgi:hypothetical protein